MPRKRRSAAGRRGVRDRPEEVSAQKLISETLGLDVVLHDDGTANSMYDLRIGPSDRPQVAIEVVGAVNFEFTRTWNAGAAKGPINTMGKADWLLFLADGVVAERLRRQIGNLVRRMETAGWHQTEGRHDLAMYGHDQLAQDLLATGVIAVYCTDKDGSGIVHLGQDGDGGAPDHTGATLVPWISAFLRHRDRADVLGKLQASGAGQRHVFVTVGFKGAPFATLNYLVGPIERLPTGEPDLPPVVDQVWIWSGLSASERRAKGVRWTGTSWATFPGALGEVDELHEGAR